MFHLVHKIFSCTLNARIEIFIFSTLKSLDFVLTFRSIQFYNMLTCMYICKYVHMYVCMFLYMYTYIYTYTHTHKANDN